MDRKNRIIAGIAIAICAGIAFIVFAIRGCMDMGNKSQPEAQGETKSNIQSESYYITDIDSQTMKESVIESEAESLFETVYVLKLQEGVITIYKDNGEFYDYAQINTALLPAEVESELRMGMEVIGEEGLYEFLQGYAD